MLKMKVIQCAGRISTNTRLHQLRWSECTLYLHLIKCYRHDPFSSDSSVMGSCSQLLAQVAALTEANWREKEDHTQLGHLNQDISTGHLLLYMYVIMT